MLYEYIPVNLKQNRPLAKCELFIVSHKTTERERNVNNNIYLIIFYRYNIEE